MLRFASKRFLVTGAGSGIGRALAQKLATEGAAVSLLGRDLAKLENTRATLAGSGHDTWSVDLAIATQIDSFIANFSGRHDALHGLLISAAEFVSGRIADAARGAAERMLAVNTLAPLQLCQFALPLLRATRGEIVFVNTSAVDGGAAGVGLYTASKAALRALANTLRAEENAAGVRVLSVFPGRTATRMAEAVAAVSGRRTRPERLLQPEDIAEIIVAAMALPATAEVTDLHIRPRLPPIDD